MQLLTLNLRSIIAPPGVVLLDDEEDALECGHWSKLSDMMQLSRVFFAYCRGMNTGPVVPFEGTNGEDVEQKKTTP